MYEIKSQRDVSVEVFVDDICDAMESLDRKSEPTAALVRMSAVSLRARRQHSSRVPDVFAVVAKASRPRGGKTSAHSAGHGF